MDYFEWEKKYKPIESEPWSGNYLLETYGEDLNLIKETPEEYVWTLLDSCGSDDGKMYIVSGFHYVNRIAYIRTRVPLEGDFLEVLYD